MSFMSNNVFIIGNGFDLYHKLPTRYTDFLFLVKNWEEFYSSYMDNLVGISETEHSAKHEQFSVSVDEYGKLTQKTLIDFANHALCIDNESMSILEKIISRNFWIKYFLEIEYSSDGWIDFEREIENLLKLIEGFAQMMFYDAKKK